jgi:hypothetical protein
MWMDPMSPPGISWALKGSSAQTPATFIRSITDLALALSHFAPQSRSCDNAADFQSILCQTIARVATLAHHVTGEASSLHLPVRRRYVSNNPWPWAGADMSEFANIAAGAIAGVSEVRLLCAMPPVKSIQY